MSALTDLFTSLANKIRNKLGTASTYTPAQAISAIDDVYSKGVTDTKKGNATTGDVKSGVTFTSANGVELTGTFAAQEKTVTAGTSASSVTPDSGKYLSKVTVNPTSSQTKSVTPTTSSQTVTPDSGKLLSSVSVGTQVHSGTKEITAGTSTATTDLTATHNNRYIKVNPTPSQTKSATPSTSAQTISPDSGKLLSSVSVAAISPVRNLGTAATGSGIDNTGPYVYIPYGWWKEYSGKAGSSYTYMTAAQAVAACPKQEKTVTGSRSAQTVTPDSGKLLSKVTVNKYPDASGTYTPSGHGTALDMGATNNYRYVNTTNAYNQGRTSVYTNNQWGAIHTVTGSEVFVFLNTGAMGLCTKAYFQITATATGNYNDIKLDFYNNNWELVATKTILVATTNVTTPSGFDNMVVVTKQNIDYFWHFGK